MFRGFHEGMGAGGWVLMSLFWVGLLAVIVWAIARIVPARSDHAREPQHAAEVAWRTADEPLGTLDRRLASGEIDIDTYDQLRSKLSSRPASGGG
jgi:putative membrane protein